MGLLNHMQGEAETMNKNGMRTIALFSVLVAFALLLASGGSRLIGHTDEYQSEMIEVSVPLRAALTQAPRQIEETGIAGPGMQIMQRHAASRVQQEMRPPLRVVSDANGNVLRCRSYLHTVYQAFSLGDGFV